MADRTSSRPQRRLAGSAFLALILIVVVVVVVVVTNWSSTRPLQGPTGTAFAFSYTAAGKPLPADALAKIASHPVAGLIRKDGKGFISIRRDKSADGVNGENLAKQINAAFKKRLGDYK